MKIKCFMWLFNFSDGSSCFNNGRPEFADKRYLIISGERGRMEGQGTVLPICSRGEILGRRGKNC
jgi:hypothetical protein